MCEKEKCARVIKINAVKYNKKKTKGIKFDGEMKTFYAFKRMNIFISYALAH